MVHFSVSIFKNQEGNETILETKGMMLIKKYTHSNIYLYHLYNGAHHSNIKRYKVKKMNRKISVNLYKEYTYLKSKELEGLPRFEVMSWQPFQLPWSASLCLFR